MSDPRVLLVEDEPDIAELYVGFLAERYDVTVADTVAEAIAVVAESFDAVLLDRRLPDGSGDEVLDHIRTNGYDCRVAMVTAVEPDFDILEMGFDLYLTKPISRSDLLDALDSLLTRNEYDDLLQEAAALASKRAILETKKSTARLEDNDGYAALVDRLEELDADLDALEEPLSTDDYRVLFRDIGGT